MITTVRTFVDHLPSAVASVSVHCPAWQAGTTEADAVGSAAMRGVRDDVLVTELAEQRLEVTVDRIVPGAAEFGAHLDTVVVARTGSQDLRSIPPVLARCVLRPAQSFQFLLRDEPLFVDQGAAVLPAAGHHLPPAGGVD
jgi:hypothetical protein